LSGWIRGLILMPSPDAAVAACIIYISHAQDAPDLSAPEYPCLALPLLRCGTREGESVFEDVNGFGSRRLPLQRRLV
ncbi:hypothetical protein JB92DRAFT_2853838, partial [Gautieria morchelliformis]